MKPDHSTKHNQQSDSPDQSKSIDLQIKVLRRALKRIHELQNEYSMINTQARVAPSLQRD